MLGYGSLCPAMQDTSWESESTILLAVRYFTRRGNRQRNICDAAYPKTAANDVRAQSSAGTASHRAIHRAPLLRQPCEVEAQLSPSHATQET